MAVSTPIARLALLATAAALLPALPLAAQPEPAAAASARSVTLPAGTVIMVTPVEEITSIDMREGDRQRLVVAQNVFHDGVLVIPSGAPVDATVTWRTGKGMFGKSAKFELTFESVSVGGRTWRLRGMHRQEGRGNTAAAVLGAFVVTGRSAEMTPGQMVPVSTAEAITVSAPPA